MGMRMTLPSLEGLRPRSEVRMAFSTAATIDLSHGSAMMSDDSGTFSVATCAIGVGVP